MVCSGTPVFKNLTCKRISNNANGKHSYYWSHNLLRFSTWCCVTQVQFLIAPLPIMYSGVWLQQERHTTDSSFETAYCCDWDASNDCEHVLPWNYEENVVSLTSIWKTTDGNKFSIGMGMHQWALQDHSEVQVMWITEEMPQVERVGYLEVFELRTRSSMSPVYCVHRYTSSKNYQFFLFVRFQFVLPCDM